MNIIGLDLGTKTGWAVFYDGGSIESGVNSFDVHRGEDPGMRYVHFRAWLKRLLLDTLPDLVVYEQAFQRGGIAAEVAAGFTTRVQEVCALAGVHHTSVNATTLKKFATGKGNASKGDMIQAALDRWGAEWTHGGQSLDDEADARWVAQWAVDTLS